MFSSPLFVQTAKLSKYRSDKHQWQWQCQWFLIYTFCLCIFFTNKNKIGTYLQEIFAKFFMNQQHWLQFCFRTLLVVKEIFPCFWYYFTCCFIFNNKCMNQSVYTFFSIKFSLKDYRSRYSGVQYIIILEFSNSNSNRNNKFF